MVYNSFQQKHQKHPETSGKVGESTFLFSPWVTSYKSQMSSYQQKSQSIQKKKQENMSHLKVKNKWTIIIPEEVQTLDLLDKFCKATVLNMLEDLKENKDK